jgi:hypothetical protein
MDVIIVFKPRPAPDVEIKLLRNVGYRINEFASMSSPVIKPYGRFGLEGEDISPPDFSGSPSKQRRRKSWLGGSTSADDAENETAASRRRRRRRWCCAFILILLALGIAAFGALIATKQVNIDALFGQRVAGAVNYTTCVQGWQVNLFSTEATEQPCAAFSNETRCSVTVNCCWDVSTCGTYEEQPDCNTLKSSVDCERNAYCAWRSPENVCCRADRNREVQVTAQFDECSTNWDMTKSISEMSCSTFAHDQCNVQLGCCWKNDACTPAFGDLECSERRNQEDCERTIPDRQQICLWDGAECFRGGGMEATNSPTNKGTTPRPSSIFPTTPRPTLAQTTPRPTTLEATQRPTMLSKTNEPTPEPSSAAPTHPQTARPTLLPTTSRPVTPPPKPRRKTSFLILLADDLGWGDVSYIAGPSSITKTPNIDEMARGANTVNMVRFHSSATTCSPTRASLLSGRNHLRDCVWGANARWDHPFMTFRAEFPFQGRVDRTLGVLAKANGWKTLFLGKFHLATVQSLTSWGFDQWAGTGGNMATFDSTCFCGKNPTSCFKGHYSNPRSLCGHYGCQVFSSQKKQQQISNDTSSGHFVAQFESFVETLQEEDQFLAVMAFHEPHLPFIGAPWLRDPLLQGPLHNMPNNQLAADYIAAVAAMDQAVGRARAALKKAGRDLDTLVFFSSDNGPEEPSKGGYGSTNGLKGLKRSLFEGGHRVPVRSCHLLRAIY